MKKKPVFIMIGIIIVVVMVWVGLSHYEYSNTESHAMDAKKTEEENKLVLDQLKTEVMQLKNQAGNANVEANAKFLSLQQQMDILSNQQKESAFVKPNFALQEIADFIQRAGEVLEMTRNVREVSRLLEAALKKDILKDSKYAELKKVLEQDVKTLQDVPVPDVHKIWFSIDSFITKIDVLPKKEFVRQFMPETENKDQHENQNQNKSQSPNQNKDNSGASWQNKLLDNLIEFRKIISIQRHEKPVEPFLSDIELLLETERLKLLLEQVRLAALEKDQPIFDLALKNSIESINQYFIADDSNVQEIEKTLKEFSKVELNPTLPVLNSLQILQNLNIGQ